MERGIALRRFFMFKNGTLDLHNTQCTPAVHTSYSLSVIFVLAPFTHL